jgi:hypothetical protein
MRDLAALLLGLVLGLLIGSTMPSLAHGDAQWIAADPRTSYCCGISDCERAPLSAVKSVPGGWYIPSTGQTFLHDSSDLHVSKDNDPWWCRPPSMGGKVKCLFMPGGGA